MKGSLIVRYSIGGHSANDRGWRCLRLAVTLMHRLVPDAKLHVQVQGGAGIPPHLSSHWPTHDGRLVWHLDAPVGMMARWLPPRYDEQAHEVFADNDHIMWKLPAVWAAWRDSAAGVLVWDTGWSYYGSRSQGIYALGGPHPNAGFFGLPPLVKLPAIRPEDLAEGADPEQEEMGHVALHLAGWRYHFIVPTNEVMPFNPTHNALGKVADHVGTCGVHLMGINRGWNPEGERLLAQLEQEHL